MLIEASFFLALFFTLSITYFLYYCSKHKILTFKNLPYNTPSGLMLTFINSLLFAAILVMVLHSPGKKWGSEISLLSPAFAQGIHNSFEANGYFPQNAVNMSLPITTFAPYSRTIQIENETLPESPTLLAQISAESIDQDELPKEAPVPTPAPIKPTAVLVPEKKTDDKSLKPIVHRNSSLSDGFVYVISLNGHNKGYSAAYLNSITIHKDLIADTRILITVKNGGVNFVNLDTGMDLHANEVAIEDWTQYYEGSEFVDLEIPEEEVYPTGLSSLTI